MVCGVAVSCQWGSPPDWLLMMDACPGSARPKWTWILCANSLSKQQHGRQLKKKKCSSSRLGIPITWSSLKVQRLPFHDHKNRWLILKNMVNSDTLNARKKHTTSRCLFMKWSPGCLAKKIFILYHIRCFFLVVWTATDLHLLSLGQALFQLVHTVWTSMGCEREAHAC